MRVGVSLISLFAKEVLPAVHAIPVEDAPRRSAGAGTSP
jgi:hypothetical protein